MDLESGGKPMLNHPMAGSDLTVVGKMGHNSVICYPIKLKSFIPGSQMSKGEQIGFLSSCPGYKIQTLRLLMTASLPCILEISSCSEGPYREHLVSAL